MDKHPFDSESNVNSVKMITREEVEDIASRETSLINAEFRKEVKNIKSDMAQTNNQNDERFKMLEHSMNINMGRLDAIEKTVSVVEDT